MHLVPNRTGNEVACEEVLGLGGIEVRLGAERREIDEAEPLLDAEQGEAFGCEEAAGAPAAAGAAEVAGERREQDLGALREIGVQELALPPLREDERRRRLGEVVREAADGRRGHAGDRARRARGDSR